jgi:hypothetical protein
MKGEGSVESVVVSVAADYAEESNTGRFLIGAGIDHRPFTAEARPGDDASLLPAVVLRCAWNRSQGQVSGGGRERCLRCLNIGDAANDAHKPMHRFSNGSRPGNTRKQW